MGITALRRISYAFQISLFWAMLQQVPNYSIYSYLALGFFFLPPILLIYIYNIYK